MTRENHPEGLKVSYDLAHDVMHSQPLALVQNRFERLSQYFGEKIIHFPHHFLTIFLLSVGHTKQFEMSICALKSFLSKCLLPIYSFCLLLIVFSFLCFSIASSRCLCYLFKRTASPFRCTFLSCLLLISFQHKLAFPFFLFSKFFIYFSSFCAARPINNTYTTLALLMQ